MKKKVQKRQCHSEQEFLSYALSRFKTLRNGWPDFFVQDLATNELFGVEVKQGGQPVSKAQRAMFAALEEFGLKVVVWNPRQPQVFTPWRTYKPQPVLRVNARRVDCRRVKALARKRRQSVERVASDMARRGLAAFAKEQTPPGNRAPGSQTSLA